MKEFNIGDKVRIFKKGNISGWRYSMRICPDGVEGTIMYIWRNVSSGDHLYYVRNKTIDQDVLYRKSNLEHYNTNIIPEEMFTL